MYRLKKNVPEFEAVDGPLAGRKFRHGATYEEIPPGDAHRFESAERPPREEKEKPPLAKRKEDKEK